MYNTFNLILAPTMSVENNTSISITFLISNLTGLRDSMSKQKPPPREKHVCWKNGDAIF